MDWLSALREVLLSAALCGLIGLEREWRNKTAGTLIHTLVGSGATLVTLISVHGFPEADPTRLVAQMVTGIGFIGAGVIMRRGYLVRGLVTAATLWVTLAIGIAVGVGWHAVAVASTLLVIALLSLLPRLTDRLPGRMGEYAQMELEGPLASESALLVCLGDVGGVPMSVSTSLGDEGHVRMVFHVPWQDAQAMQVLSERLRAAGARRVTWRSLAEDGTTR